MSTILLVILVLLLVGGLPSAGLAPAGWGYYPSGGIGIVLVVVLVLVLMGRV